MARNSNSAPLIRMRTAVDFDHMFPVLQQTLMIFYDHPGLAGDGEFGQAGHRVSGEVEPFRGRLRQVSPFHIANTPIEEIYAAQKILRAAGLRKEGVNLIACPTCGRTRIDLIPLAEEVERRLADCEKTLTVAVMGCAVNGPGEAAAADCGIAGGIGEGLLFQKGEIVKKVPQDRLVDELFALIEEL